MRHKSPHIYTFLIVSLVLLEEFEKVAISTYARSYTFQAKDIVAEACHVFGKQSQKHSRRKIVWAAVSTLQDVEFFDTRKQFLNRLFSLESSISQSTVAIGKELRFPFENTIQRQIYKHKEAEFEKKKHDMCLHYINTYGDESLLTEFYLQSGLYKDACRYLSVHISLTITV